MKDSFRAVLVRAAIGTMRRAMATAARPTTMTTLRAVGTGLEARSGRRDDVTRALAVAHSPWSFAARGISDSIPTRGDDDKNAADVPSTSAGDAKDVHDVHVRQVRDSRGEGFQPAGVRKRRGDRALPRVSGAAPRGG